MEKINKDLDKRLQELVKTKFLFRVGVSGDELWETYIKGFKEEDDPIFRDPSSSTHSCNCCKAFLRRYGNIVAIDPNTLETMTLFDNVPEDPEYISSFAALKELVKNSKITNIFVETKNYLLNPKCPSYSVNRKGGNYFILGHEKTVKRYTKEDIDRWPNSGISLNQIITFNHLHLSIPRNFIDDSGFSAEKLMGEKRDIKNVFERGIREISIDTMDQVLDLEAAGSLLNGSSFISKVKGAKKLATEFKNIPVDKQDNWFWLMSCKVPTSIVTFRNSVIGTLLIDIEEGKPLEVSCRSFNEKVDPVNFMKATAPVTQKMINEAQKKVEELGLTSALERRCATLDDICVSEILHSNTDTGKKNLSSPITVFDSLKPTTAGKTGKDSLKKAQEVSIEDFMNNILPGAKDIQAWLSVKHKGNLMTLTTSVNKDAGNLFKWNNPFALTFEGGLAGKSQITQAVKSAGGFVDAPFRCSILWNSPEIPGCVGYSDIVDLDLHATEPGGNEIYYGSFKGRPTNMSGMLDIDMINPRKEGVENIFWTDMSKVRDGKYHFFIHNYNSGRNHGARAEILFEGQTYQYLIPKDIQGRETIATVWIKNGKIDKIEHSSWLINSDEKVEEMYNLKSGQFHKVKLVSWSPNYWAIGETRNNGPKFACFFLEGAVNPSDIRTIHNENLTPELHEHRKVFEVLGSQTKCESVENQLSGIAFNTEGLHEEELYVKVDNKRVIKIKF